MQTQKAAKKDKSEKKRKEKKKKHRKHADLPLIDTSLDSESEFRVPTSGFTLSERENDVRLVRMTPFRRGLSYPPLH
jgi:hypothetical protein